MQHNDHLPKIKILAKVENVSRLRASEKLPNTRTTPYNLVSSLSYLREHDNPAFRTVFRPVNFQVCKEGNILFGKNLQKIPNQFIVSYRQVLDSECTKTRRCSASFTTIAPIMSLFAQSIRQKKESIFRTKKSNLNIFFSFQSTKLMQTAVLCLKHSVHELSGIRR